MNINLSTSGFKYKPKQGRSRATITSKSSSSTIKEGNQPAFLSVFVWVFFFQNFLLSELLCAKILAESVGV